MPIAVHVLHVATDEDREHPGRTGHVHSSINQASDAYDLAQVYR